jgi:hypothetical protein
MSEEHKKNARPSSREQHEKGQARKQRDTGGEKGDKRRRRQQRKRRRPEQE